VIYGSVCSGIEAATVAWRPLGWRAAFFSEIEPFPCALLSHYYAAPNYGDMTRFKDWPDATIDVLVGGTPCQPFSISGLRKGLADPRGNLTLTYLAVADKYRPRWLVWENVPGVLSDRTGAFGAFLGGLAKLGYGFAYRILDAQYAGIPQRRRRVFVVGCLGDWRRAAAVLFERHSLQGHPAPGREAGERIAPTISARPTGGGGTDFECDGGLIPMPHAEICPALKARDSKGPSSDGDGDGDGAILVPMVAGTLRGHHGNPQAEWAWGDQLVPAPAIAFGQQNSARQGASASASVTPTLDKSKVPGLGQGLHVRRLTPRECERLQGFPDDYTLIPFRGKPAADGPRYKALGNSMAVPVIRWLGERIGRVTPPSSSASAKQGEKG
jgi:DNA (cytosine-5)-methyltransferase 1